MLQALTAIFRRRKRLILILLAAVAGGHLVWAFLRPQAPFEAQVRLSATTAEAVPLPESLADSLQQGEGRARLQARLRDGGGFSSLFFAEGPTARELDWRLANFRRTDPNAARSFTGVVEIETSAGGSGAVEIRVQNREENLATLQAWALADVLCEQVEQGLRARRGADLVGVEHSIAQVKAQRKRLQAESDEIAGELVRQGHEERERSILASLFRIEEKKTELRSQVRKNERRIEYRLQDQHFAQRGDVAGVQPVSERYRELEDSLHQARLELDSRLNRFPLRHPDVRAARTRVADLESRLETQRRRESSLRYERLTARTSELIEENGLIGEERSVLEQHESELRGQLQQIYDLRSKARDLASEAQQAQEELEELEERRSGLLEAFDRPSTAFALADPLRPAVRDGWGATYGPVALSFFFLLIFSCGVVGILEYMDTRLRTVDDVRESLDLPLLAAMPPVPGRPPMVGALTPILRETARVVRKLSAELHVRVVMMTSSRPGEGSTTACVELGVALAREGARVLIIDANFYEPGVHRLLALRNEGGLSNLLEPHLVTQELLQDIREAADSQVPDWASDRVVATVVPGLFALPCGQPFGDPQALLESKRMASVLRELRKHYDVVILDVPPVLAHPHGVSFSGLVDGAVLVVGAGKVDREHARKARDILQGARANLFGVILNQGAGHRGNLTFQLPPEAAGVGSPSSFGSA